MRPGRADTQLATKRYFAAQALFHFFHQGHIKFTHGNVGASPIYLVGNLRFSEPQIGGVFIINYFNLIYSQFSRYLSQLHPEFQYSRNIISSISCVVRYGGVCIIRSTAHSLLYGTIRYVTNPGTIPGQMVEMTEILPYCI